MSDPAIDPIDSFLWLFADMAKEDPEGIKSREITKRIHLALSTDEIKILDRACQEALKNYQKKLKTGL